MAEVPEIVGRCRRYFEDDKKHHDIWARKVDAWYRAYRGEYQNALERGTWRSQVNPPYLLQIVETLASGLSDPNPRWKVKPRPKAASPEEILRLRDGASQLERLLAYQREIDGMLLKQRNHRLQGLIAGLSVWKTYWRYEETKETRTERYVDYDEERGLYEAEREVERVLPLRDDPCVEVVDVRDWIWPESAPSLEKAPRIHHRVWMTMDELRNMEKAGLYKNVGEIRVDGKRSNDDAETALGMGSESSREIDLHDSDRTRGRIQVIEHWIDFGKRVVTIANDSVLLSDRENPFAHGGYPFVTAAPIPELFRIPGVSIVELVEDLQEMVWNLQRQTLDNIELINNAVIVKSEDSLDDDPVLNPGEVWIHNGDRNTEPHLLELGNFPADIALNHIQSLKADIQGVPGASPALLGQADSVEQTATEVSLMANLAQRRLAAQKQQFTVADVRVAEQWIDLNRQFLTEKRWVAIVGKDGDEGWELIDPDMFSEGQFAIQIEQMEESLVRQERLAEATSRFQVALQAAPVMAAIGQPLNMKAILDDIWHASGVEDTERYYSATPQPGGAQMAQGGAPQQPGIPTEPGGLTAPQATDMNSPSNPVSQSPMASMQRLMSMTGGPANG